MKKLVLNNTSYQHLLKAFKEWLDILGYSPKTVEKLPNYVQEFLHQMMLLKVENIKQIQAIHIQKHYENLSVRANERRGGALSNTTINEHIYGLEKFFEFLHHKGVQNLPTINIKRLKTNKIEKEILTINQVLDLFEIAEKQEVKSKKQETLNQRDLVMMSLYYSCGLRRTEGVNINLEDVNLDQKILHIKKGKGNKQRMIPFSKTTKKYLNDWIYEHRNVLIKDKTESRLLIGYRGKPISGAMMHLRLKQLIEKTKNQDIKEKNISLHSLRHSIATHLLSNGMKIEKVQQFLGHSSLESTQIYTHLINE